MYPLTAYLGEECDQLKYFSSWLPEFIHSAGWTWKRVSLCSGGGPQLQACMYVLSSFFHPNTHTHTHTSCRRPSINDSHVKPVSAPWGSYSLMLPSIIMLTVISSSPSSFSLYSRTQGALMKHIHPSTIIWYPVDSFLLSLSFSLTLCTSSEKNQRVYRIRE